MRWRRVIVRAGVVVVIGAVINLVLAAGLALWMPVNPKNAAFFDANVPRDVLWDLEEARGAPVSPGTIWVCALGSCDSGPGVTVFGVADALFVDDLTPTSSANPDLRILYVLRAGWPCRALACRVQSGVVYPIAPADVVRHGIEVPRWVGQRQLADDSSLSASIGLGGTNDARPLPTRFLWPGFLIGTAFHSGILSLLWGGRRAGVRWRRRRRGLCPSCAYEVGTLSSCPECGTPVRRAPGQQKSPPLPGAAAP